MCFVLDEWERWVLFADPLFFSSVGVSFVRHVTCCDFLMAVRESLFLWGLFNTCSGMQREPGMEYSGVVGVMSCLPAVCVGMEISIKCAPRTPAF